MSLAEFYHSPKALGALFGLSVGDSLGSYLEFSAFGVEKERVEKAMSMPGGGPHGVAPGQVTDDTELALALATALDGKDPRDGFPEKDVLAEYLAWFKSGPFDVGHTCSAAFGPRRGHFFAADPKSQSNGSLMRIAPLAVWASLESDDDIARLASEDAKLSHASGEVVFSTAAYSIALAALVRGETPRSAIERASRWLRSKAGDEGADEVALWLADSDVIHASMTSRRFSHSGWVRHAFVLAFWHLSSNTSFEEAMREIMTIGGDSDTNAAIVGAMLGARDGHQNIPKRWKQLVLDFDSNAGRHPRPPKYHPCNFFAFVDGIYRT